MAEPRIGMKFSSYLEMGKEYEKKSSSAKISSYERNTNNNSVSTASFKYTGTGHTYDKDIKYTKIYGSNSYAIDLNHNGIVDKGEIKKY